MFFVERHNPWARPRFHEPRYVHPLEHIFAPHAPHTMHHVRRVPRACAAMYHEPLNEPQYFHRAQQPRREPACCTSPAPRAPMRRRAAPRAEARYKVPVHIVQRQRADPRPASSPKKRRVCRRAHAMEPLLAAFAAAQVQERTPTREPTAEECEAAATVLQRAFRARAVRHTLRHIAADFRAALRQLYTAADSDAENGVRVHVSGDPLALVTHEEALMQLLFRLDAVATPTAALRARRKALVKVIHQQLADVDAGKAAFRESESEESEESESEESAELEGETKESEESEAGETKESEESEAGETKESEAGAEGMSEESVESEAGETKESEESEAGETKESEGSEAGAEGMSVESEVDSGAESDEAVAGDADEWEIVLTELPSVHESWTSDEGMGDAEESGREGHEEGHCEGSDEGASDSDGEWVAVVFDPAE